MADWISAVSANRKAGLIALALVGGIYLALYLATTPSANNTAKPNETVYESMGTRVTLVEHGGHQYLVVLHGGIVHAESCPCRQQQQQSVSVLGRIQFGTSYLSTNADHKRYTVTSDEPAHIQAYGTSTNQAH